MADKEIQRPTSLVPKVMLLEPDDLACRINWIDAEIRQLSNSHGVASRIQGLRYSRAQLEATQAIIGVMNKGHGFSEGTEHDAQT